MFQNHNRMPGGIRMALVGAVAATTLAGSEGPPGTPGPRLPSYNTAQRATDTAILDMAGDIKRAAASLPPCPPEGLARTACASWVSYPGVTVSELQTPSADGGVLRILVGRSRVPDIENSADLLQYGREQLRQECGVAIRPLFSGHFSDGDTAITDQRFLPNYDYRTNNDPDIEAAQRAAMISVIDAAIYAALNDSPAQALC